VKLHMNAGQQGQAMVEFLLVAAVLTFALFFPYLHGRSVVSLLMQALTAVLRSRSYLISIL
jgi:hypothetical protein